eukprot:3642323-Amphidinium_carterae.1
MKPACYEAKNVTIVQQQIRLLDSIAQSHACADAFNANAKAAHGQVEEIKPETTKTVRYLLLLDLLATFVGSATAFGAVGTQATFATSSSAQA